MQGRFSFVRGSPRPKGRPRFWVTLEGVGLVFPNGRSPTPSKKRLKFAHPSHKTKSLGSAKINFAAVLKKADVMVDVPPHPPIRRRPNGQVGVSFLNFLPYLKFCLVSFDVFRPFGWGGLPVPNLVTPPPSCSDKQNSNIASPKPGLAQTLG